jgi:mRNA interferase YafQ
LATDQTLPEKFHDHPLTGEYTNHRECHLKPDLLLIYKKPDEQTLRLVRIGSHSEVFRQLRWDWPSRRARFAHGVCGFPTISQKTRNGWGTRPKGIPVATLAIGKPGAANAALFAVEILALTDEALYERLAA